MKQETIAMTVWSFSAIIVLKARPIPEPAPVTTETLLIFTLPSVSSRHRWLIIRVFGERLGDAAICF